MVFGIALGAAASWGAITYLNRQQTDVAAETEVVELTTAPVEQRDLLEEIEWTGTLGFGQEVSVGGNGGTVTAVVPAGTLIERGDVIAEVDGEPVIAMFGDTPMWRGLTSGDVGVDVFQLETNLAALGYDEDQTVDIDTEFTANTSLMVERWQEDLGLEITGSVEAGRVAIVAGPSSIISTSAIGSVATSELVSIAPERSVTDVVASIDGVITDLAPAGETIEHGTVLYAVEEIPVVAIVETDAVSAVLLSETYTSLELEEVLAAEGYDPDDAMTVDGVITDATESAVESWQASAGLPVTGRSEPGYYLAVPAGRAVDGWLIDEGESVADGGPILTASTSELSVDVVVDVADADEFELDQLVSIEMADESVVDGAVSNISAVIRPSEPQGTPTVEITIAVVASAEETLVEGPVTVLSIGEAIVGATVVPTRALVSLAEGGFAVEKAGADGSTALVAVELGNFDDGVVEVVEGDLSPGDNVVVPK